MRNLKIAAFFEGKFCKKPLAVRGVTFYIPGNDDQKNNLSIPLRTY